MKKEIINLILLSIVLIFLIRCASEEANPVGNNFYPREKGEEYRLVLQGTKTDTSFHSDISTRYSPYLYVGNNSTNQAVSLIRFNLPDTGIVDSGFVKLFLGDPIGTAPPSFPIQIQLITEEWLDTTVNWENFNIQAQGEELYSDDIVLSETDSILFNIPPRIINEWIDSTIANYGFIISSSSTESIIQIFSANMVSDNTHPRLSLFMHNDTTNVPKNYSVHKDLFIATSLIPLTKDRLNIANGTAFRSIINFDIEPIPSSATINRALILLYEDSLNSSQDTTEFKIVGNAIDQFLDPLSSVTIHGKYTGSGTLVDGIAKIDVTNIIQQWSSLAIDNKGILLKGQYETIDLSWKIFNSTSTFTPTQPKLEIYYTTPPKRKY